MQINRLHEQKLYMVDSIDDFSRLVWYLSLVVDVGDILIRL